jgi:hypothetical protein
VGRNAADELVGAGATATGAAAGAQREPVPTLTAPTVPATAVRRPETWEEAEARRNEEAAKAHSGVHI